MDITASWSENYTVFVEIGAASSVFTRLVRVSVPKKTEAKEWFRRFLHFVPILGAALLLGSMWLFPTGGFVVLHSVTLGGMSSNFRDVFNLMQKRLSAGTQATEAKADLEKSAGGVLEAVKPAIVEEIKKAPEKPKEAPSPSPEPTIILDEKGS